MQEDIQDFADPLDEFASMTSDITEDTTDTPNEVEEPVVDDEPNQETNSEEDLDQGKPTNDDDDDQGEKEPEADANKEPADDADPKETDVEDPWTDDKTYRYGDQEVSGTHVKAALELSDNFRERESTLNTIGQKQVMIQSAFKSALELVEPQFPQFQANIKAYDEAIASFDAKLANNPHDYETIQAKQKWEADYGDLYQSSKEGLSKPGNLLKAMEQYNEEIQRTKSAAIESAQKEFKSPEFINANTRNELISTVETILPDINLDEAIPAGFTFRDLLNSNEDVLNVMKVFKNVKTAPKGEVAGKSAQQTKASSSNVSKGHSRTGTIADEIFNNF